MGAPGEGDYETIEGEQKKRVVSLGSSSMMMQSVAIYP